MFDFFPSKIDLNISIFIIIIALIVSSVISYYYYRKTIPPIPVKWRIFLWMIRSIMITSIIILILATEITIYWQKPVKKRIIFVIDRSASMEISENKISRLMRSKMIAEDLIDNIGNKMNISTYLFDVDTVKSGINDIESRDLGTNMDAVLKKIIDKEKDLSSILLISDGIFTQGDNPLYSENVIKRKIFTIGIGDTSETPDLAIHDVYVNKILYQNKPATFHVELSAKGINRSISVFLKNNDKVLDARNIEIKTDESIIPVSFIINPDKLGLIEYEIYVEPIASEEITENNRFITTVEVLKEKINVGIFASKPNYDIKFLSKILKEMKDIYVKTSVTKSGTISFLSDFHQTIDSSDVIILHNYPAFNTPEQYKMELLRKINQKNTAVLIIIGDALFQNQITFFKKIFPLLTLQSSGSAILTQVKRTEQGNMTSLLKIYDSDMDNKRLWSKCPPLEYLYNKIELKKECKILLETTNLSVNQPVLVSYQGKGSKRLLLLGSGFWRWTFQLYEDKQFRDGWATVFYNMIRWMASGYNYDNIMVTSKEKSFYTGEVVNIDIEVYDGAFNPVSDAIVGLNIYSDADSFKVQSENIGNGMYQAKFIPLTEGRYKIIATAWQNDIKLGNASYEIIATPVNNEFIYTKQDYRLLQKLADKTGGEYFSEHEYNKIVNYLDSSPDIVHRSEKIELWNRISLLLIIIILLSLEWYFRKRKGLA